MADMLQFIVMVDGALGETELVQSVLDRFPDAVRLKAHSCDVADNWLEVWHNDDADESLTRDGDGFLHFRWRVEVTPMNDALDEDHQIRLARGLLDAFQNAGGRAVVLADFEDRV